MPGEPPVSPEVSRAVRPMPAPRAEDRAHVRSRGKHGVPQGTLHVDLCPSLPGHPALRAPVQRQVRGVPGEERARQGVPGGGQEGRGYWGWGGGGGGGVVCVSFMCVWGAGWGWGGCVCFCVFFVCV